MARLHIKCRNLSAAEEWEAWGDLGEQSKRRQSLRPPRNIQLEAYERRARERRKYRRQAKFTPLAPQYDGR
jgi:hypothetical protein